MRTKAKRQIKAAPLQTDKLHRCNSKVRRAPKVTFKMAPLVSFSSNFLGFGPAVFKRQKRRYFFSSGAGNKLVVAGFIALGQFFDSLMSRSVFQLCLGHLHVQPLHGVERLAGGGLFVQLGGFFHLFVALQHYHAVGVLNHGNGRGGV